MKSSKNFHLGLGLLFTVDFIISLSDQRVTHELSFWDVNIWIYRGYRLAIALLFIGLYFKQKKKDSNVQ